MGRFNISKRRKSLIAGVACGLLCALCVGIYVTEVDSKAAAAQADMLAQYGGEQIEVCVAKRDIAAGEVISESDIEMRTWIVTLLPANAVTDRKNAVGKQVGSTILEGEVISESRFGFETAAIDVPDGLVAISIPTREVQSVGGAISPGAVVDVYAVGATSTTRLVSAVQVLATSMDTASSKNNANAWVTIAIVPEKVQELVSAAQNLEIYFTLPSESALASLEEKTTDDELSNRKDSKEEGEAK